MMTRCDGVLSQPSLATENGGPFTRDQTMRRSSVSFQIISVSLACSMTCGAGLAQAQVPVAPTPAQVRPDVEQAYVRLMASPQVQKLLDALKADHARSVDDLKALTEIEAPPFKEQNKAEAFL